MTEADRAKWEARYAGGGHAEAEPEPLLAQALAFTPPIGRALDVACGRGRHAIALARAGYAVDAIDISAAALASARERAAALDVRWREADLDSVEIERGAYAVICCIDFTDDLLMPRLVDGLGVRGLLVYAARPKALGSFGPREGDLDRWFGSLETLIRREGKERVEYAGRHP